MKLTQIAAGVVIAMAASVAAADYVQIGFDENEYMLDEPAGVNTSSYNTAVNFGFSPIADSPLGISGSFSSRIYDASNQRGSDFTRQQLYVNYKWTAGDFTFSPKAGIRRNDKVSARDMEYRLYPNFGYKLSDSTSVHLNTFFNSIRSTPDTGSATKKFNYEVLAGVKHSLTSVDYVKFELFTEQTKNKETDVKGDRRQLRAAYGHNFGDVSAELFGRYDVKKESDDVDQGKETRIGLKANYIMNDDWSVSGVAWHNTDRDNDAEAKLVYSLFIKRSF